MSDNVTAQAISPMVNTIITIVSSLVFLLVGFFLNAWNSNRIERKQGNKISLKEHFDDFIEGAARPINKVLKNIGSRDGYISGYWDELRNIQEEQFLCFLAHYPLLAEKWIINLGEFTKGNNLSGGNFHEQNEIAEKFEKRVSEIIKDKLTKVGVNLPVKQFSGQEEINDAVIGSITSGIYSQIENAQLEIDFNKAEISDDGFGFFLLKLGAAIFARAENRNTIETCKSIFIEVQNTSNLKNEASTILKSANQIKSDLEFLEIELDKIQSRGLISNYNRYKFKPTKHCPICHELFFTK